MENRAQFHPVDQKAIGASIWLLLAVGWLTSCLTPQEQGPLSYAPPYFADSIPYPSRNPLTDHKIQLGQKLFGETALSANGQVSCQSCHLPALAFTDGQSLTTHGVSGKPLLRHSPPLFNLAWHPDFFWDGGAKDLESQVFAPLQHPDEMGFALDQTQEVLEALGYRPLFQKAFGIREITAAKVARALASYQRSLISDGSRYDQWVRGQATLSDLALMGKGVFDRQCASCHPAPFFTDFDYHSNGLDRSPEAGHEDVNLGRGRITLDPSDRGRFKTPSLRNLGFTAPYMHDGRFETLEEVIYHYSHQIKPAENLDPRLDSAFGASLRSEDRGALIAFLRSLDDSSFIQKQLVE